MKYLAILAAVVPIILAKDAVFIDNAKYTASSAPTELKRIAIYRTNKKSTLTIQQNEYLDQIETVVQDFDTGRVANVAAACEAVFGKQECNDILFGQETAGLSSSLPPNVCSCADSSAYCPDAQFCKYKAYGCIFTGKFPYYY